MILYLQRGHSGKKPCFGPCPLWRLPMSSIFWCLVSCKRDLDGCPTAQTANATKTKAKSESYEMSCPTEWEGLCHRKLPVANCF